MAHDALILTFYTLKMPTAFGNAANIHLTAHRVLERF
jgi:hypothetical protein